MPLMWTTLAKPELLDHAAGNEGVGQLAGVVGLGIAEETVAVGVHFQHAAAGLQGADLAVFLGEIARPLRIRVVACGTHRPVVTATITISIARPRALHATAAQPASFLFCHIAHLKKTPLLRAVKTSPRISRRAARTAQSSCRGMLYRTGEAPKPQGTKFTPRRRSTIDLGTVPSADRAGSPVLCKANESSPATRQGASSLLTAHNIKGVQA